MCKAFGSEVRIIASGYDTKAAAIAEAEGFFDFNQVRGNATPGQAGELDPLKLIPCFMILYVTLWFVLFALPFSTLPRLVS